MRPGILRSGAIYGMANLLSAGVPFMLLPVLTRALDPTQYGQVVSFYMLVAVCASVAGLGVHSSVAVRWLDRSKGDPRRHTATAIRVACISTAVAALLAAAFAPAVGIDLPPEICALAAIVAGSVVLQGMRFAIWQSQERALPAAGLQVSSALLNITLSLIGVFVLQLGGLGRILGATASGLVIAAVSIHLMTHGGTAATTPSRQDARALLRFGIPLIPHALAGALLANADRFAVSAVLGAATLGVYGTASQLGLVVNVLADASIKAYTPTLYRWLSEGSPASRLRVVAVAYLSIPAWLIVAFGLWILFRIAGTLLLGDDYLKALDLSIWFLLGGAFSAMYLNVAGLFFFTGKTEWISASTVATSLLTVALASAAVPAWGVLGGALTYLLAQLILLVLALALSLRVSPMPWHRPRLAFRVLRRPARSSVQ